MKKELIERLSQITDEEKIILKGKKDVDRKLYYLSQQNEIDASLLIKKGRLIDIRPNTRFIHFPEHTHNFVEFVYMLEGQTRHLIDGNRITLHSGDLLFMNQHARQEIEPAGEKDIAVNFIILPEFFDEVLKRIGDTKSALCDFLISCLTEKNMGGNYMYFDVSGITPVQNLMENLTILMLESPDDNRIISQQTMALLLLHLMNETEHLHMSDNSYDKKMMLTLLDYIDTNYRDASFTEFCDLHHTDIYSMGRIIKKNTGKSFTVLLAEKRMSQTLWLLQNTRLTIADISVAVGYENTSYFYRLFEKTFGKSPLEMRLFTKIRS